MAATYDCFKYVFGNVLLLLLVQTVVSSDPLELLNIDTSSITVSGISSGACMATQFHMAHSTSIIGVGMFAGAPYYCAGGSSIDAIDTCMQSPDDINVSELRTHAEQYASQGSIDVTSNIVNDRIWLFTGQSDTVVHPDVADIVADFYSSYTSNIFIQKSINAEHTYPTENEGNPCVETGSPYIGRCQYDGAFEMLNYSYGDLQKPDRSNQDPLPGTFREFDQTEYFYISLPSQSSMDRDGFVYIPSACEDRQIECRLHIAFHGCEMGKHAIGDVFSQDAGYNEVGELNNIVILYPQVIASFGLPLNPYGCWDWWGYTVNQYATKKANQVLAIARMVDKIAGTNLDP